MADTRDDLRKTRMAARWLADKRGAAGRRVGPVHMFVSLLLAMGEERSQRALEALGVRNLDAFVRRLGEPALGGSHEMTPVKPDAALESLMKGPLREFMTNSGSAEDALRVLVAPENLTEELKRFLARPQRFWRGSSDDVSARELLRCLCRYWQARYELGRAYYGPERGGLSDFITGDRDSDFNSAVDAARREERRLRRRVFASRTYTASPVGRIRREYGEDAAAVVEIALTSELGLVGSGPTTVRELAFTFDPPALHTAVGAVRSTVKRLRGEGIVQVVPDDTAVRAYHHVVVTEALMAEFLEYLRSRDAAVWDGTSLDGSIPDGSSKEV